jgi:hypothetical protein
MSRIGKIAKVFAPSLGPEQTPFTTWVGSGPITWVNQDGEPVRFFSETKALELAAAGQQLHREVQRVGRREAKQIRNRIKAATGTRFEEGARTRAAVVRMRDQLLKEGLKPRDVAARIAQRRLPADPDQPERRQTVSPRHVRRILAQERGSAQ